MNIAKLSIFLFLISITNKKKLNSWRTLEDSIDNGLQSTQFLKSLLNDAIELTDSFVETRNQTIGHVVLMLQQANGFCPTVREEICEDPLQNRNCNLVGIPYAFNLQLVLNAFAAVGGEDGSFDFGRVDRFKNDLVKLRDVTTNIEDDSDTFDWTLYCAMAFSIAIGAICLIFIISVLWAWCCDIPRCFACIRSWFIMPLFLLLVLCSWVLSMAFVIGSQATADFCNDSPDNNAVAMLNREDFGLILQQSLNYYILGK